MATVCVNDNTRASQDPIRPIRRMRVADLGSSLSMFKKAANTESAYQMMYVCTAAENLFWDFLDNT